MATKTKTVPRLSPTTIRVIERLLAQGNEVKVSNLSDGLRVSSVKYKTEHVDKPSAGNV